MIVGVGFLLVGLGLAIGSLELAAFSAIVCGAVILVR